MVIPHLWDKNRVLVSHLWDSYLLVSDLWDVGLSWWDS